MNGFRQFSELVVTLGTSTKTSEKLAALQLYFRLADDRDKVWVIAIFSGRRPRRSVKVGQLSQWCREITGLPEWLFLESYSTVGDLAETLALLIPDKDHDAEIHHSLDHFITGLKALEKQDEAVQRAWVTSAWAEMNKEERFVFNKLITGNFRIGVSQQLMVNALSAVVQLEPSQIAHRISGNWDPFTTGFEELLGGDLQASDFSKPYPFYLAYALETEPQELGAPAEWQAEWKWDGIRGQVIRRNNDLFIWSRGEELMTEKFPELYILKDMLPDGTVLDGEIMCIEQKDGAWKPLPFALLQTRIGRKTVTKKHLQESPVGFVVYDVLEHGGVDMREAPLHERRAFLEGIVRSEWGAGIYASPVLEFSDWQQLVEARLGARENGSEGLMLKRKDSVYQVGRKRGDWYKWKIDPLTIDAVMIYAQKGSGRRSNLFTDYTFAVRDGDKLVSFAKAYSGLTDKEFAEVDAFVKRNAIEKFGPVRTVKPELVFEIAFEGIAASSRHKSGVALRFPRISRWRKDKPVSEINTIEDLKQMLHQYGKKMKAIIVTLLIYALLTTSYSLFPDPTDPVKIPASPQRSGNADSGYQFIVTGDYVNSGLPFLFYRMGMGVNKDDYLLRGGDNAGVRYDFNVVRAANGEEIVVPNCLQCHAQVFDDKLIIGLGNTTIDFSHAGAFDNPMIQGAIDSYMKINKKKAEAAKEFITVGRTIADQMQTEVRGVNAADRLTAVLISHRDKNTLKWNDTASVQLPKQVIPSDVPAWWLLKKKNAMFYSGFGRGDFGTFLMGAILLTVNDTAHANKVNAHMDDVLSYLKSIEPPKYPKPVDSALAAEGQVVYETHCAKCHGFYGSYSSYPNYLIPQQVIQTDSLLNHSNYQYSDMINWFNTSWFSKGDNPAKLVPFNGYIAPPLDGIWITAPYLHNGSVPDLETLLNSKNRPLYWSRNFNKTDYDYQKLGWKYTVHDKPGGKTVYNTTLPGYGNQGHYFGDKLNDGERKSVIEYLKTL